MSDFEAMVIAFSHGSLTFKVHNFATDQGGSVIVVDTGTFRMLKEDGKPMMAEQLFHFSDRGRLEYVSYRNKMFHDYTLEPSWNKPESLRQQIEQGSEKVEPTEELL